MRPRQFPFGPFLPGNVAGDFRGANDFAAGFLDRRNRQGYFNPRPILALANGFIMVNPFTAANPVQNSGLFIHPIRRHQDGDRAPDDFLRLITKNSFRAAIPTGDDSLQIFADDGIIGGFHNGR